MNYIAGRVYLWVLQNMGILFVLYLYCIVSIRDK